MKVFQKWIKRIRHQEKYQNAFMSQNNSGRLTTYQAFGIVTRAHNDKNIRHACFSWSVKIRIIIIILDQHFFASEG
jgi:hypothetical protein